jgi:hypothetical protein
MGSPMEGCFDQEDSMPKRDATQKGSEKMTRNSRADNDVSQRGSQSQANVDTGSSSSQNDNRNDAASEFDEDT